jgi:predicted transposase YbfD/YdcC
VTCGAVTGAKVFGGFAGAGGVRAERWRFLHQPISRHEDARPPMSSSPIADAARIPYLLDLLAQVPDPRRPRGLRHPLAGLLAVGLAAVIGGSRSFAAIGQRAADAGQDVLAALGAVRGPADESTYRRAFAQVSGDALDLALGAWAWTRACRAGERLVIAIDGKAVRGAKNKEGKAPHLVAALAHGLGDPRRPGPAEGLRGPGRRRRDPRRPPRAARHRAGRPGPPGRLRHDGQGEHADAVPAAQGAAVDVRSVSSVTRDHGRRARRTLKAVLAPDWIDFEGTAQVAQLRRTVTKKGKKTVEVVYLITSSDADPATLASWVKGHWEIENRLHWVRDVTYLEDKSLVRTGEAPRVMATLRSLAISLLRLDGHANIAAANRHHARDPQRTLKLLQAA